MTIAEIRKKEIEYCRGDPVYFIEEYGHIEDHGSAELIQPFKMWPKQKDAILSIHENKLNIILKARQLGITWLALSYAAWLMRCFSGRTVVALSRTEAEAKELIRRLAVIFRNMPELVQEEGNALMGWNGPVFSNSMLELKISYPDEPDSVCKAYPSSPGAGRSMTADLVVLDEWAFQQYAREIWASAFPTINRPGGGKVIGLSTIERGSLFEELWSANGNGFNKIFLPWYTDPSRDKAWYDTTYSAMGDLIKSEYPATPEEALEVPGGCFFPEVSDLHIAKEFPDKTRKYVCLDYGLDMFSCHWVAVDKNGNAVVYREYDSPNKTIGEACEIIKNMTSDEKIDNFLAPPDLWNREQVGGRSRAAIFQENGVPLTQTSNDLSSGCSAMKEWLKISEVPKLRFLEGECPNLVRCLKKIQRDKLKPNQYSKTPHDLTHDVDSLRCFCVYWTKPYKDRKRIRKARWKEDQFEDYKNANRADRDFLLKQWGDPFGED